MDVVIAALITYLTAEFGDSLSKYTQEADPYLEIIERIDNQSLKEYLVELYSEYGSKSIAVLADLSLLLMKNSQFYDIFYLWTTGSHIYHPVIECFIYEPQDWKEAKTRYIDIIPNTILQNHEIGVSLFVYLDHESNANIKVYDDKSYQMLQPYKVDRVDESIVHCYDPEVLCDSREEHVRLTVECNEIKWIYYLIGYPAKTEKISN